MATRTARKPAAKKVVAPEPEVVEEELELEEEEPEEVDEEEEVEEEAATPTRKQSAQDRAKSAVTVGMAHIAEYLSTKTGKTVTTRDLRQLARKMARDESNRIDREIVAGNKSRYDWPSMKHPEVQAIIKAYTAGELDADKKEKLDALKASKAAKKAAAEAEAETPKPAGKKAATPAAKKATTRRTKPAVVVEEDDEELDLEDDE